MSYSKLLSTYARGCAKQLRARLVGGAKWRGRWLVLGGVTGRGAKQWGGGATVNRYLTIYTGHARWYRAEQPELAVWCLLYRVRAFILHLWGFQQCLWGSNWGLFLYVH